MRLFAVLNALESPARHEHGAVTLQFVREGGDFLGRNAALRFGPGRGLFNAVRLPFDVVEELAPTGGVGLQKLKIGLVRSHELVDHPEHHRAVGAGARRNLLRPEKFGRVGANRADAYGSDSFLLQGLQVTRTLVERRQPIDVVRHQGIRSPEDDAFGTFEHHLPRGRAGIARPHDVGKNLPDGRGRIAVLARHEPAHEVEKASLECDRTVHLPRRHPAVAPPEDGARAVLPVDAADFGCNEVERLVPGNPHELFLPAVCTRGGAFLEVALAHHRVADAGGRIGEIRETVEIGRGCAVELEGRDAHDPPFADRRTNDAPVRGGENGGFGCGVGHGESRKVKRSPHCTISRLELSLSKADARASSLVETQRSAKGALRRSFRKIRAMKKPAGRTPRASNSLWQSADCTFRR